MKTNYQKPTIKIRRVMDSGQELMAASGDMTVSTTTTNEAGITSADAKAYNHRATLWDEE